MTTKPLHWERRPGYRLATRDEVYNRMLVRYLNQGISLQTAREMAAADADFQKDKDEEREGDWTR